MAPPATSVTYATKKGWGDGLVTLSFKGKRFSDIDHTKCPDCSGEVTIRQYSQGYRFMDCFTCNVTWELMPGGINR